MGSLLALKIYLPKKKLALFCKSPFGNFVKFNFVTVGNITDATIISIEEGLTFFIFGTV